MMKAITRTSYGNPDVLEIKDIDIPNIKPDEVLVKVQATTINRTDCGILTGKPYLIRAFTGIRAPRHLVPGTDFAGKVVDTGKEVTNFSIDDRVWGFYDEGLMSHAEYMIMKQDKEIAKIPDHVSYEEAVSCGEGAHYAYNFLDKINVKKGNKVLVNGATGAIGSALIQLSKFKGANVTAVANTKNIDLIKSLGVDRVINYEEKDFTKDPEKYNYVLDAVGKSTFSKASNVLQKGGIYISSELGPNAQNIYLPLLTFFNSKRRVIFPIPKNCTRSVKFMNELLKDNVFKPVIDRTYDMDDVKAAYHYVLKGEKTGNVIMRIP